MPEDEPSVEGAQDTQKKDWADFIVQNEQPIGRLMDRVAGHIHREFGEGRKQTILMSRAQARTGLIVASVVFFIISLGLVLTYVLVRDGFLPGETFVFFVGALLGSLITFLSERVTTLLYVGETEEAVE